MTTTTHQRRRTWSIPAPTNRIHFPAAAHDGIPRVRPRPGARASSISSATTRRADLIAPSIRPKYSRLVSGAGPVDGRAGWSAPGLQPQPVARPEQRGVAALLYCSRASPSPIPGPVAADEGNSRRAWASAASCCCAGGHRREGRAAAAPVTNPVRTPADSSGGESSTVDSNGPSVLTDHRTVRPRHSGAG